MLNDRYTFRVSSLHPQNHFNKTETGKYFFVSFDQSATDGIIIIQKGLTVSRPKKN